MKRLYFDTETTGTLPRWGASLANAPHIVQLAASLRCDARGVLASINVIIRPDGWTIPAEAAAVHGITTETAMELGIPIVVALACFSQMVSVADQVVAHNMDFDDPVVGFEIERLGKVNRLLEKPKFCTMKASVDIVKIPPTPKMVRAGFNHYKSPSLMETYVHLFGREFDSAHDALADVNACAEIHAEILRLYPEPLPKTA